MKILDLNHHNYKNNVYKLQKLYPNPKIIFDIGAHSGGYTKSLAEIYTDSTIYAFEPIKETFDVLTKNTEHLDNVKCFNFGLYDKTVEKIKFRFTRKKKQNAGIMSIFGEDGGEKIGKLKSIKEFCDEECIIPDLIKMDVEGCEYKLLKELLDITGDCIFQVEINDTFESTSNLCELLKTDGCKMIGKNGKLDYIYKWEKND